MKFESAFVFLLITQLCLTAPVSPIKNKDKLSFLDEQGYEVVSDAEEILTPVSPDLDNGVHLSESDITNPKMLLYGRFYVLRRKGASEGERISEVLKTDQLLKRYRNTGPKISSQFPVPEVQPIHQDFQERTIKPKVPEDSMIFFPEDETQEKTSTAKKYIRQGPIGGTDGIEASINRPYIWKTRPPRAGNVQDVKGTQKVLQPSASVSFSDNLKNQPFSKEVENMSPEQFVAWAKANLNPEKLSYFLEQAIEEGDNDNVEDDSETTPLPGIQYNSFILVPGLKCPEGQRVNHRGICTPKYVHVPSQHDALILRKLRHQQTKRRLQAFVKTLFQLAVEVDELEKLETADATMASSTLSSAFSTEDHASSSPTASKS